MKPLLFQLVYQAASMVLTLIYTNKYFLGRKDYYPGRKQRIMNNALEREDNGKGSNDFGTGNSSYINS